MHSKTIGMTATLAALTWVTLAGGAATAQAKNETPNFTVVVSLSPKALAEMTAKREEIVLSAYYAGQPTKAAEKRANEIGEIDLGSEERRLPAGGGTVAFTGKGFEVKRLGWVAGRKAEVNLNVYSARKSSEDNLLDCTHFQDAVTVAAVRPIAVTCKLIGEK